MTVANSAADEFATGIDPERYTVVVGVSATRGSPAALPRDQLARDVEKVLGPDSGVECRLLHGGRRKMLLAAAGAADLLVIDAPRRTDLSSAPMFAQRLIHHAGCPVVIMPPALSQEPDTAIMTAGKRIGRGCSTRPGRPAGRVSVHP